MGLFIVPREAAIKSGVTAYNTSGAGRWDAQRLVPGRDSGRYALRLKDALALRLVAL